MQFGPGTRARTEDQQAYGFAAVAQGHHKQSRPSILAALRVADQGTRAVIDLGFFPGSGDDDGNSQRRLLSALLAHPAFDASVLVSKAVLGNQILPDGHGIAPTRQPQLNHFAIGLTGTDCATTRFGTIGIVGSRNRFFT